MTNKTTNPEYIIIYLDLIKETVKRKRLTKALETFAEEKEAKNPNSNYRLFYFKEDMSPFLSEQESSMEPILTIIKEDWQKHKGNKESQLENGIFYCLSQIAQDAVNIVANFRILIISDIPSKQGSAYKEAMMDLVETVRTFPTFIDIIRIGDQKFYSDDVILQIISRVTSGGLFYIENEKKLQDVLKGLARNKRLPDLMPEGGQVIDQNKKLYFENLAANLVESDKEEIKCSLCPDQLCSYCGDDMDVPLECPNCEFAYHECCAALHSWKFNIGLKHIFRCINCGILLKLDENNVYLINGEPLENESMIDEILPEGSGEETWKPPTDQEEDTYIEKETQEVLNQDTDENKKKGPILIGGLFGPKIVQSKKTDPSNIKKKELQESRIEQKKQKDMEEEKKGKENKEGGLAARRRKRSAPRITYCPFCAKQITSNIQTCTHCGSPIF